MAKWAGPGCAYDSKTKKQLNPGDDVPVGFFEKDRFDALVKKGKIEVSEKFAKAKSKAEAKEGDK